MSVQLIHRITRIANILGKERGRKRPISRYETEGVLHAIHEVYVERLTPHVGEVEAYPDKLQEAQQQNR